jgi:hypothetical protein
VEHFADQLVDELHILAQGSAANNHVRLGSI